MRAEVLAGLFLLAALGANAGAQTDVPVVMLSDLHFDPFRDAAKVPRLDKAPVAAWEAILKEPNSEGQAAGFAAMQSACGASAVDSSYTLMNAALKAAAKQAGGAKFSGFVTLSGDLQVHQFECRYKVAMKGKEDYLGFAAKTASYVMEKVQAEFGGAPVYVALGNNDTGCGDYALDVNDRYFAGTSAALLKGLKDASVEDLQQAKGDYEAGGYYAVTLPGAMKKTRLVVIDDMYMSNKYSTCAKRQNGAGQAAVLAWMSAEIAGARQSGETVWVLGHIPPGVDVYSTVKHALSMCSRAPTTFLADESLGDLLKKNADVVKLAIFGHTHSDEFRVFGDVPVKIVGSVTPVNGNVPMFTVAKADGATGRLNDYAVYVASNKTGVGTEWTREYGFDETFHVKSFTAASLDEVIARLKIDSAGQTSESMAYLRDFFPGGTSPLSFVWPQYVCSMKDAPAAEIQACMCPKE